MKARVLGLEGCKVRGTNTYVKMIELDRCDCHVTSSYCAFINFLS